MLRGLEEELRTAEAMNAFALEELVEMASTSELAMVPCSPPCGAAKGRPHTIGVVHRRATRMRANLDG